MDGLCPRVRETRRRVRLRALSGALLLSALLAVTGCALSADPFAAVGATPDTQWQPQQWPLDTAVVVSAQQGAGGADVAGDADPATDADSAGGADSDSSDAAATAVGELQAQTDLGLLGGRIRNDSASFAARYTELPLAHAFNDRVEQLLWDAIAATGAPYTPEVSPVGAGLGERGCVPGSLRWPAAQLLTDPATGVTGGSGTVVTCEVLGAFGDTVAVGMRVVSGVAQKDAEPQITADRIEMLYANVTDGTLLDGADRWTEAAPTELWLHLVEQLRRASGGLSSRELAAPSAEQVAIAQAALDDAHSTANGELIVSVGVGITSPELSGLGVEPTAAVTEVVISQELAATWVTPELQGVEAQRGSPFVGLPGWSAALSVDCALVPCVALTYDDGPSDLTPALLDTLAAQRAPATFFVVGTSVAAFPDTVARIAADGHEVASHTMKHPDLTQLPLAKARGQVLGAARAITEITGQPVTSFRPPYGAITTEIIDAVGLPAILWTIDTNDWQRPGSAALIERSVTATQPGDIVLFHDVHPDSVAVAGDVITGLRDRGFTPVTVSEMFDGAIPAGRVSGR